MDDRKRGIVFSAQEDAALLEAYFARKKIIEGTFSSNLTTKDKKKAWEQIAAVTNAIDARSVRDVEQIKQRYKNMLKQYKNYMTETKNPPTGGGKPLERKPFFEIFDRFMADDSRIAGICESPLELGPAKQQQQLSDAGGLPSSSFATVADPEASASFPPSFTDLTPIRSKSVKFEAKRRKVETELLTTKISETAAAAEMPTLKEMQLKVLEKEDAKLTLEIRKLELELEAPGFARHALDRKFGNHSEGTDVSKFFANHQFGANEASEHDASQLETAIQREKRPEPITFQNGEPVFIWNLKGNKATWLPATIIERVGNSPTYRVGVPTLRCAVHRLANQIRRRFPVELETPQLGQANGNDLAGDQTNRIPIKEIEKAKSPVGQSQSAPRRSARAKKAPQQLDMDPSKRKYDLVRP
ncbi:hypothetical protein niasHT_033891 [Heterodera trifolii]|uniref:Regulatory protein zeste n=1 Tax=Heterodera trifolii TaxID=157864 RepID=A0ABD2HX80_9BILA